MVEWEWRGGRMRKEVVEWEGRGGRMGREGW